MSYTEHYLDVNGQKIHYLVYPANGPVLLLLHGLTANAHAFGGLIEAGLTDRYQVISMDLRGRGLSDHPETGYSQEEHAADVLGLLDHLGLERVVIAGHSFGGLLGFYLGAHHPGRVERLVILDAAMQMNPRTAEMLGYRLASLDRVYPSPEAFLDEVKAAPYLDFWEPAMEHYYQADLLELEEGGYTHRSSLAHIIQASMGLAGIPWPEVIGRISAPVLLVNATGVYALEEALLPQANALETVALLQDARYVPVPGNHQTMLYGPGAEAVVQAIREFNQ